MCGLCICLFTTLFSFRYISFSFQSSPFQYNRFPSCFFLTLCPQGSCTYNTKMLHEELFLGGVIGTTEIFCDTLPCLV
jgi:hypothetical protein